MIPFVPLRQKPPRAAPALAQRSSPKAYRERPRRIPHEFYPTPPEAVRALLSVEAFDGDIWEPACGDGAISKTLSEAGHAVVSTDLVDQGFGEPGVDFLQQTLPRAKHIITNPPYGRGLADAFIRRALTLTRLSGGAVAMLLNLQSLCHSVRTPRWRNAPPAAIYAVDDIVCWPEDRYGPAPRHIIKHRYCWVVWRPGHQGDTIFNWLSGGDFR